MPLENCSQSAFHFLTQNSTSLQLLQRFIMGKLMILILLTVLIQKASLEIKIITEKPTQFGDAPYWCASTNSLYYVDFFGVKYNIYRYDYSQNKVYAALILHAPSNAGFIIPIEGRRDEFAVGFADRTVKRIFWNGKAGTARIIDIIFEVEQDPYYKDNLWHISTIDPFGRFYGGTMRKFLCTRSIAPDGAVYSYDRYFGVTKQLDYVELSNGIAHSLRKRKMFHINACQFVLKSYDWDIFTGKISNGRKLYQIYKGSDVPTYTGLGLAIDVKDNLYIGCFNCSSVIKVDSSTGKKLKVFDIPTPYALNVAFGGPNLDEMFVVTGQLPFDLFAGELKDQKLTPSAGCLHIIKNVGATGYAGRALRLN